MYDTEEAARNNMEATFGHADLGQTIDAWARTDKNREACAT